MDTKADIQLGPATPIGTVAITLTINRQRRALEVDPGRLCSTCCGKARG